MAGRHTGTGGYARTGEAARPTRRRAAPPIPPGGRRRRDGRRTRQGRRDTPGPEGTPGPERRLDGQPVDAIHADLTARRGGAGVDLTGGAAPVPEHGRGVHGRHQGRPLRRARRAGERLAARAREPQRQAQFGGSAAVDERDGRDPAPGGQMDRRFRLGHGARGGGALQSAVPARTGARVPDAAAQPPRVLSGSWWRHVEPRQGMWRALAGLSRYIATPTVAKHRLFVWLDAGICPTTNSSSSRAMTTPPSASCTAASTRRGRCGSARGSARATIRAIPRPPPSRPSPSPKGCRPTSPPPAMRAARTLRPSPGLQTLQTYSLSTLRKGDWT